MSYFTGHILYPPTGGGGGGAAAAAFAEVVGVGSPSLPNNDATIILTTPTVTTGEPGISYDDVTGRWTVEAGIPVEASAKLDHAGSSTARVDYVWWDVTADEQVGNVGQSQDQSRAVAASEQPDAEFVRVFGVQTLLEVRNVTGSNQGGTMDGPKCNFTIKSIGGPQGPTGPAGSFGGQDETLGRGNDLILDEVGGQRGYIVDNGNDFRLYVATVLTLQARSTGNAIYAWRDFLPGNTGVQTLGQSGRVWGGLALGDDAEATFDDDLDTSIKYNPVTSNLEFRVDGTLRMTIGAGGVDTNP